MRAGALPEMSINSCPWRRGPCFSNSTADHHLTNPLRCLGCNMPVLPSCRAVLAAIAFAGVILPQQQGAIILDSSELLLLVDAWWGHNGPAFLPEVLPVPRGEQADQAARLLFTVLQGSDNRDLLGSALIAAARIGIDAGGQDLLAALRRRLDSRDQEIQESAALALGLAGRPAAVDDLTALALDRESGRRLCGGGEVSWRTRAFAMFGLGILAGDSADPTVARRVLDAAKTVLELDRTQQTDVRAAAVHALSLLRPDLRDPAQLAVYRAAVAAMDRYAAADRGADEIMAQAHVPTGLAKLMRATGAAECDAVSAEVLRHQREWRQRIAACADRGDQTDYVLQSAVLALGVLPPAGEPDRTAAQKELDAATATAADPQARLFAMLSLGRIGGAAARSRLLALAGERRPVYTGLWARVALGVLEHDRRLRQGAAFQPDRELGKELLQCLSAARFDWLGASALAVGLARPEGAAPALATALDRAGNEQDGAALLCEALAMAPGDGAMPAVRRVLAASAKKPMLLQRASLALRLLGDPQAVEFYERTARAELAKKEGWSLATLAFTISALGRLRDARTTDLLLQVASDERLTPLTRAFGVAALGLQFARTAKPWNFELARDTNYRAAQPTLTGMGSGVLDIW